MRAYRETFRRHRVLYLLPALIAAVAVGALSYKAPTYVSTSSLWVDNQAGAPSSLNVTGATQPVTPAGAEETVLTELLATKRFDDAVIAGAGLPHSDANAIGGVTAVTPGPQVLEVTCNAASPQEAYRIVKSVITQLQSFTKQWARQFASSSVAYYRTQVATATQALSQAQDATARASAKSALLSDTAALNQAVAQASASDGFATGMVLGQPTSDPVALTGYRKLLGKTLGGLLAGLLLSALLIAIRTPSRHDEWDEELAAPAVAGGAEGIAVPAAGHPAPDAAPAPPVGVSATVPVMADDLPAAMTGHMPGDADAPAYAAVAPLAAATEAPGFRTVRRGGLLRRNKQTLGHLSERDSPAAVAEGGRA